MPKFDQPLTDAKETKTPAKSIAMGDLFLTMVLLGASAVLRDIAAAGVNVNVTDTYGRTLLMLAVDYGATCRGKQKQKMMATITCLLENGADANLADETGDTALSRALKLRQKDLAKLLLNHASDFPSQIN